MNGVGFPGVRLTGSGSKGRNKVSVHGEHIFTKHEGNITLAVMIQRGMATVWSDTYLGGGKMGGGEVALCRGVSRLGSGMRSWAM